MFESNLIEFDNLTWKNIKMHVGGTSETHSLLLNKAARLKLSSVDQFNQFITGATHSSSAVQRPHTYTKHHLNLMVGIKTVSLAQTDTALQTAELGVPPLGFLPVLEAVVTPAPLHPGITSTAKPARLMWSGRRT